MQARTGRPLTITVNRAGGDLPDGNNRNQRPDVVPGVDPYPATKTPDQWLNIAAFAVPARGTWGNVARNTLRGPGLFQVDLALQKRFADRRTAKLRVPVGGVQRVQPHESRQIRARTSARPAQFGRITEPLNRGYGTGTARQMQFMFRLNF